MPTSTRQYKPILRKSNANPMVPLGRCGHRPLRVGFEKFRFRQSHKAARKYLAGGLCRKNASQAPLRLYAYENLPQLSAVISRKATGEDLLFAPAAAGKQRLCMKPRAGQKQYGTKQPAGVGARPFESIFYGSVLSILRASAANSGSIVRRLCDFSSPISSCISVIDFPRARR